MPDYEKFLEELSELTRKYGITIGGCGCCGSPWLMEMEDGETDSEYRYRADCKQDLSWGSVK
jgi:hypothetical protein